MTVSRVKFRDPQINSRIVISIFKKLIMNNLQYLKANKYHEVYKINRNRMKQLIDYIICNVKNYRVRAMLQLLTIHDIAQYLTIAMRELERDGKIKIIETRRNPQGRYFIFRLLK